MLLNLPQNIQNALCRDQLSLWEVADVVTSATPSTPGVAAYAAMAGVTVRGKGSLTAVPMK